MFLKTFTINLQLKIISCKYAKIKNYFTVFRVKSGFDSENLMWLEQLFRQTVGDEMEIKRDDFNKILITKNVSPLFY